MNYTLKVVLIRPGSTDYDVQERIAGALDIPLNEQGMAEAAQAAERLRDQGLEVIYSPLSQPSHQTAEIIADTLDVKLRKLDKMQGANLGLWQGMLISDIRHKQPKVYRQMQEQPETVCPPEGEMLSEADDRVRACMTKLFKRHREGVIGIVLPEPLLSLARRFTTQQPLGDLWKPAVGHESIEVFEVIPEDILALA